MSIYSTDPDEEKRLARKGLRKVWDNTLNRFRYEKITQTYVPKPIEELKAERASSGEGLESVVKAARKELVPSKARLNLMQTSDPDYYAENLLYEIKQTHQSVLECFNDLKKHMTVIEKMTINRRVKKRKTTS